MLLAALVAAGCGPPPAGQAQALAPLPPEAVVHLADLEPRIARPILSPAVGLLPEHLRRSIELAEQAIESRRFQQALAPLQRAVRFEPKNPRIRLGLGLAYAGIGSTGKAKESLLQAVEDAPNDLRAQLVLGRLAMAENKTRQAIIHLRTALLCSQAEPSDARAAEALLLLGRLLEIDGKLQASLDCYDLLYERMGDHGRQYAARPLLKTLVRQSEKLLGARGSLLLRLGKPAEAAELLDRAYRRNRTDLATARLLAEALKACRRFARAEELLTTLAAEPSQRTQIPKLAESLCVESGDKEMPGRIWQSLPAEDALANERLGAALARAARSLGAYDQAKTIARSLMKLKPGDAGAACLLAGLFVRERQWEQALSVLARTLAKAPDSAAQIDEGLAEVVRGGPLAEAKARLRPLPAKRAEHFTKAAKMSEAPDRHALCYVAGRVAGLRGNLAAAEELFGSAIAAEAKFFCAYEALAEIHMAAEDFDKAAKLVAKVQKAAPHDYFPFYLKGKVAMRRGWTHSAIMPLQRAHISRKGHVPTIVLLAKAYAAAGQNADAERMGAKAVDLAPDRAELYEWLFERLMQRRQYRGAAAVAGKFVKRYPRRLAGHLMGTEVLIGQGRFARAAEALKKLRGQYPDNMRIKLLGVQAEMGKPEWMLPRDVYDRTVKLLGRAAGKPDCPEKAKVMLGRLLTLGERHAEAAPVWRELHKAKPLSAKHVMLYVRSLGASNQHAEAVEVLTRQLLRNRRDATVGRAMLDSLAALGRHEQAAAHARTWYEQGAKENDPNTYVYAAQVLSVCKKGKLYEAGRRFVDVLVAAEDDPVAANYARAQKLAFFRLPDEKDKLLAFVDKWVKPDARAAAGLVVPMAVALADAKLHDKAHAILDRALAAEIGRDSPNPVNLEALRQLKAIILTSAEQYDKALGLVDEWLGPAVTTMPTTMPATVPAHSAAIALWCRVTAVRILRMQGKHAEAVDRARRYLQIDPKSVDLLSALAASLIELGRGDEALEVMQQAQADRPDLPTLCNNLGYRYAELGIRLAEAEQLIRKALATRKAVHIMDSLAWVYYKQGRYRQAGAVFQEAIDMTATLGWGRHPVIYDHAGDAYYRLGWRDKAIEHWKQAVELAKKVQLADSENSGVLKSAPGKIRAASKGLEPAIAPLGKGVKE